MTDSPPPNEHGLVEHFFRHEHANVVSVLTRAFGFGRIELIEDMVHSAMLAAMKTWSQGGVPENPAGWIHRVARNRILDALSREKTHSKAIGFIGRPSNDERQQALLDDWLDQESLPDNLLRMMFVCCHPTLDRSSQVALTLRLLCGFSISEIARGLLVPSETAKKRIQRAKSRLRDANVSLEMPTDSELQSRIASVHETLYLMFNEGYSTSHGITAIRDDVCEESARLCHILCLHPTLSTPASRALLALMLFHGSRLAARVDSLGNVVLLDDQDRGRWDHRLIQTAKSWLTKSTAGTPSRYHFEAAIAKSHCEAGSFQETDWPRIVQLYDLLLLGWPSPIYRLNRAIALGHAGDFRDSLDELSAIRQAGELRDYPLLHCAIAHVHELAGDPSQAVDAYLAALHSPLADHRKKLIETRLRQITKKES